MYLFSYTKKLAEKIKYYDKLVNEMNLNLSFNNPFKTNKEFVVIWVENLDDDNN
ncbi:hypothetical protein IKU74_01490 [bacterium]|nr:hypothetical protein [bacterium]